MGDACKDKEACLRMDGLTKCSIVPQERTRAPLPRQSETHVLSVPNFCPNGECCHNTDEKRALTGTWVIEELRLAVQKGYRILEIHELYEYNVTRYDAETLDSGLFVGDIDTLRKFNAEASGYQA